MNFVIFGRPAGPPQPPRPWALGCQMSWPRPGRGGVPHFDRARSGVRTVETSGNPGSKNPDFPLKTAHRLTDRGQAGPADPPSHAGNSHPARSLRSRQAGVPGVSSAGHPRGSGSHRTLIPEVRTVTEPSLGRPPNPHPRGSDSH
eukprot:gene8036-biopygen57